MWLPILVLMFWSGPQFSPHDLRWYFEAPRFEYHWRFIQATESECKAWGKREAEEAMATRYRVECKRLTWGKRRTGDED